MEKNFDNSNKFFIFVIDFHSYPPFFHVCSDPVRNDRVFLFIIFLMGNKKAPQEDGAWRYGSQHARMKQAKKNKMY